MVRLIVAAALVPGVVLAAMIPPMASLVIAVVLGIALNIVEARMVKRVAPALVPVP
jgi:hypothetical protein